MGASDGLYIGLLSGTSLDGIDAALVHCEGDKSALIDTHQHAFSRPLQHQLVALCQPDDNEIDRLGACDRELGKAFAAAALQLLERTGIDQAQIVAIGCHGQTIRHRPQGENAFTLQIGDPNTIAWLTGITTVADFRRMDIAAGGQGAPLAPAFHRAAFGSKTRSRCIINIGGMSNISYLPASGEVLGFDAGPGNVLMDGWIARQQGLAFDRDGAWATSGTADETLLTALLRHPFLQRTPPKSTGREDFHLDWLDAKLAESGHADLLPQNVQATLAELTARSIADAIQTLPGPADEIYLCGGGAHNLHLARRLQSLLPETPVASTEILGIAPDWVEAALFAWLARRALCGASGNLPAVTGAAREVILGAVYRGALPSSSRQNG